MCACVCVCVCAHGGGREHRLSTAETGPFRKPPAPCSLFFKVLESGSGSGTLSGQWSGR